MFSPSGVLFFPGNAKDPVKKRTCHVGSFLWDIQVAIEDSFHSLMIIAKKKPCG